MLGISTPDAIALGTLILAALAAWQGRRAGEAARRAAPEPAPSSTESPLDRSALRDLADAVRLLANTVADLRASRERRDASDLADTLRRIEAELLGG